MIFFISRLVFTLRNLISQQTNHVKSKQKFEKFHINLKSNPDAFTYCQSQRFVTYINYCISHETLKFQSDTFS